MKYSTCKIVGSFLLLHIIIVFFIALHINEWKQGRILDLPLESIPNDYSFVLFPKNGAKIFENKEGKPGAEISLLDRALIASEKEIKAGLIEVNLEKKRFGLVPLDSLHFWPSQGDPETLLRRMERTFKYNLGYKVKVKHKNLPNHLIRVSLDIRHEKSPQSTSYHYVTDGEKIVSLKPAFSGVDEFLLSLLCFVYLFLSTWIILSLASFFTKDKSYSLFFNGCVMPFWFFLFSFFVLTFLSGFLIFFLSTIPVVSPWVKNGIDGRWIFFLGQGLTILYFTQKIRKEWNQTRAFFYGFLGYLFLLLLFAIRSTIQGV